MFAWTISSMSSRISVTPNTCHPEYEYLSSRMSLLIALHGLLSPTSRLIHVVSYALAYTLVLHIYYQGIDGVPFRISPFTMSLWHCPDILPIMMHCTISCWISPLMLADGISPRICCIMMPLGQWLDTPLYCPNGSPHLPGVPHHDASEALPPFLMIFQENIQSHPPAQLVNT